jgi:hypothetical protein
MTTIPGHAVFASIARRLTVEEQIRATMAIADAVAEAIRAERRRCLAICAEHSSGEGSVADKIARKIGDGANVCSRYQRDDVGPFGEG